MATERTEQRFALTRALLPGHVASTVGYGPTGDDQPQRIHRGLPSPYLTFIVSVAAPVATGHSIEQALGDDPLRNHVLIGGLSHRPSYVVPDPCQHGIQLAVHPMAARALFGLPAGDLLDVTNGIDVLGGAAEELRQRLAELEGWQARFALLGQYLHERVDDRPRQRVRSEVAEAWRWLARRRGMGSMSKLAEHVLLSPRQLTTLFAREVGASPKQVGRLMRFDHAKQRITKAAYEGRSLDLAAIAAACGYYDHAHLDRDFAQYVGVSPTGWLAEERRNIQAQGHRNGEDWGT